ncbi:hypothetical protein MNBD_PLANCTO02-3353, partial [hydrothermal vent metagenome]
TPGGVQKTRGAFAEACSEHEMNTQ